MGDGLADELFRLLQIRNIGRNGQNLAARNTVTAYSVRGLESPSVATPLTWEEVAALTPDTPVRVSPSQMLERVALHGDLFAASIPTAGSPALPAEF